MEPVRHRAAWVAGGLVLQLAGVGAPVAYVLTKAKRESVTGLLSVASVRLTWHASLHTKAGVALLAGGAALFVVGCVLLARPFVRSRLTLLLAVPLAALVGVLVLGVLAQNIAVAVAGWQSGGGGGSGGTGDWLGAQSAGGGSGSSRSGKRADEPGGNP
jgi:hypothetical protein